MAREGFSLIEVIVVILIVGILAAIAIPRITYTSKAAKAEACNANAVLLNSQIDFYYMQVGTYPANLNTLASEDYIDAVPACPFGTAYPYVYDTLRHRVTKHAHP